MNARANMASIFAAPAERNWDGLQFRAIFALVFPVYLLVATGARLAPSHWRGRSSHRSIFSEATSAAGTTARMAFAG